MSTKCFVSYLINHLRIRDQHNSRLLDGDHADGDNSNNVIMLFDEPIEYVWIQGVIMVISSVADDSMVQWIIDDGTGVIMILIRLQTNDYPNVTATTSHSEFVSQYSIGDYVLVQGSVVIGRDEETAQVMRYVEALLVSPVRDPNMETLWSLEVVDGRTRDHDVLLS